MLAKYIKFANKILYSYRKNRFIKHVEPNQSLVLYSADSYISSKNLNKMLASNVNHIRNRELDLIDRRSSYLKGYCYNCKCNTKFGISLNNNTDQIVNWRESLVCYNCRLNNRTRAAIHIIFSFIKISPSSYIYITEQKTPLYRMLSKTYKNLIGSEYLGNKISLGHTNYSGIRNEDFTSLSFKSDSQDLLLTFDVLEHIFNYKDALKEAYRILKENGILLISVPFNIESNNNIKRAILNDNNTVTHILEPEYHGDPNSTHGCLCYYHFGWELLDDLCNIGFKDVKALFYNSMYFGYLGSNQLYIYCRK